jgi:hypothetical protein
VVLTAYVDESARDGQTEYLRLLGDRVRMLEP